MNRVVNSRPVRLGTSKKRRSRDRRGIEVQFHVTEDNTCESEANNPRRLEVTAKKARKILVFLACHSPRLCTFFYTRGVIIYYNEGLH